jgi:dTDP-L-rhamnose 4-epimerase
VVRPTRVLVTGGAGFIGSHTVDALLARGHDVVVLDSLQPRVHPRGRPAYLDPRPRFIHGDVTDRTALLRALDGVRVVFHLAAYQDYMTDFSQFIRTNTESTALLFELVVERRLPVEKMLFASSQSVAGEGVYRCAEHGVVRPGPRPLERLRRGLWEIPCPSCERPMQSKPIDEATCSPHTAYAISKYTIELLADRLGRRYGIPTVCLRYTYVQGPRNSFYNAYSGICRIFTMRVLNGLPPVIYEDGLQLRDYVNVSDVARANVLAMESPATDFAVLNVGGGRAVTVRQFADLVITAAGRHVRPLIPGEFRLGDTRHTVSDISALRALGWVPAVPVEENVLEYVEWLREQQDGAEYLREAERVMRERQVIRRADRASGEAVA